MSESYGLSKHSFFRAVYVEESALDYPLSREIMASLGSCPFVFCQSYREIFNRPGQHMQLQKTRPALILAVKQPPFVYRGPRPCQNFGRDNFLYANLAIGCPFDCEYCFLQGLYLSGDIVVFVNTDDIFAHIALEAAENSLYLALSHDSDLLALHGLLPHLIRISSTFLSTRPQIVAEIRTKSAAVSIFQEIRPLDNLIIAYSLAPQVIIDRFENRTPSLKARIKAINAAIKAKFNVRICFDPYLLIRTWIMSMILFSMKCFPI